MVFWLNENVGLKRPIYIAYLDSVSVCVYVFDKSKFNHSMIISKWGESSFEMQELMAWHSLYGFWGDAREAYQERVVMMKTILCD